MSVCGVFVPLRCLRATDPGCFGRDVTELRAWLGTIVDMMQPHFIQNGRVRHNVRISLHIHIISEQTVSDTN
jgi:hypothetical protein